MNEWINKRVGTERKKIYLSMGYCVRILFTLITIVREYTEVRHLRVRFLFIVLPNSPKHLHSSCVIRSLRS